MVADLKHEVGRDDGKCDLSYQCDWHGRYEEEDFYVMYAFRLCKAFEAIDTGNPDGRQ